MFTLSKFTYQLYLFFASLFIHYIFFMQDFFIYYISTIQVYLFNAFKGEENLSLATNPLLETRKAKVQQLKPKVSQFGLTLVTVITWMEKHKIFWSRHNKKK